MLLHVQNHELHLSPPRFKPCGEMLLEFCFSGPPLEAICLVFLEARGANKRLLVPGGPRMDFGSDTTAGASLVHSDELRA